MKARHFNIRSFVVLVKGGLIEALSFRTTYFFALLGNIIYLFVIYNLWGAIFSASSSSIVNGMTFYDTMIYLVLANALYNFMDGSLVREINNKVQSGQIILDMIKPISFKSYLLGYLSGGYVYAFIMNFLPTFILIYVFTKGKLVIGVNLVYFLISVILAVLINFYIDFLIGIICIYTHSVWGINTMKDVIVLFLSGATIPLAFFPDKLRQIVELLPFEAIYNIPLSILNNYCLHKDILFMIAKQGMWVVILWLISEFVWKRAVRNTTINGG